MSSLSERASATVTAPSYSIKKRLTFQQFKLVAGVEYVFRIMAPMYTGHELKNAETVIPGIPPRKPPTLMQVTMHNDGGQLGVVCAPQGVVDTLNEEFPQDTYVGRDFVLIIIGKRIAKNGNNFNEISFHEIELNEEDDAIEAVEPVAKAKGRKA